MPIIRIKECICDGPCKGQPHDWEFRKPLLSESRIIAAKTEFKGTPAFLEALGEEHPEAWTALLDILHRRSGIGLRWEQIDLDIEKVHIDFTAEEQAEYDAAMEEERAAAESGGKVVGLMPKSPISGDANAVDLTPRFSTTPPVSGSTSG